ncbi:soluble lytic murein transglycosylase-like protein [Beggiatoa alba B18LD]|uniref:Soluble lytic murein transglycosylase-like protein n=1 Tax=Beggiatoa alba B18LD TaxID=395493 RepID=I3CGT4_9GAMM|nr:lytic transglycosylase domain-containing protein [Beggiatoa alba]EIJ42827.1 soluble lytic murein transglycosylase-like protein [Beggiatoa alba B18LD]
MIPPVKADTEKPQSVTVYKYIDERGVLHLSNKPPITTQDEAMLYSRSYKLDTPTPRSVYLPIPQALLLPNRFTPPSRQVATLSTVTTQAIRATRKTDYDSYIQLAALDTRVEEALLHAVIKVESNYNAMAVSPKGATGLMQLMPNTASRFGVLDSTNPQENIQGGSKYLRYLLDLFNNDLSLALAAYNAGEGAVMKYGNTIPPYPETQNYVIKVTDLYHQFLAQL